MSMNGMHMLIILVSEPRNHPYDYRLALRSCRYFTGRNHDEEAEEFVSEYRPRQKRGSRHCAAVRLLSVLSAITGCCSKSQKPREAGSL